MKHAVYRVRLIATVLACIAMLADFPASAQQAPAIDDSGNANPGAASGKSGMSRYSLGSGFDKALDSALTNDLDDTKIHKEDIMEGGLGGLGYPSSTISGTN